MLCGQKGWYFMQDILKQAFQHLFQAQFMHFSNLNTIISTLSHNLKIAHIRHTKPLYLHIATLRTRKTENSTYFSTYFSEHQQDISNLRPFHAQNHYIINFNEHSPLALHLVAMYMKVQNKRTFTSSTLCNPYWTTIFDEDLKPLTYTCYYQT